MRLLDWLREMASVNPERLPAKAFIPLLTDRGEPQGVILVHDDQTRDIVVRELTFQSRAGFVPHGGNISSYFADQLGATSGLIYGALQSGQLLQIVGSPEILAGLNSGSLSIMRSAGQMTGTVVSSTTHSIVGQLRFAPANVAGIVAPLAIWQIMHAVAGVVELRKINLKLDALQREIERLAFRLQAKTYGQLVAAVATLEELSMQYATTGTFSPDMTVKLSLAERDIKVAWAGQRLLVQRFDYVSSRIIKEARGKQGAFQANQILKEEAPEYLVDANLMIEASRASILASESWIRHDLEHNPRHVPMRLRNLEREMDEISKAVSPMRILEELQGHAVGCLEELNWFSKNIFNRQLVKEVSLRSLEQHKASGESHMSAETSSVVVWKDQNNETKSVVIGVAVEK